MIILTGHCELFTWSIVHVKYWLFSETHSGGEPSMAFQRSYQLSYEAPLKYMNYAECLSLSLSPLRFVFSSLFSESGPF